MVTIDSMSTIEQTGTKCNSGEIKPGNGFLSTEFESRPYLKISRVGYRLITLDWSFMNVRLKPVPIAKPQGVKAFIGFCQIGVGNMIEHQGDEMALADANPCFERQPEENS